MEALLSDDDEYTPSYDDEDEYSSESDDFLIHRDSDELQVFMNEYEKTLKLNLYFLLNEFNVFCGASKLIFKLLKILKNFLFNFLLNNGFKYLF